MGMRTSFVILFLLLPSSMSVLAQSTGNRPGKKERKEDKELNMLPLIFSSPETGLAFGAIGVFQKHLFPGDTTSRKSVAMLGVSYALNNQFFVFTQPDIFFKKEKFRLRSSLGYGQILDRYWGIGNETAENGEEEVEYNQVIFESAFYYQYRPNLFIGWQYRLNNQFNVDREENGLLEFDGATVGGSGSLISGMGPALLFDNRENQVNPSNGWFLNLSAAFHGGGLASEFDFDRYLVDVRHYIKMHPKEHHILALQGYGLFSSGQPPFKQMAELGGAQMRGYFVGRFRDRNMVSMQAEYRSPLLFWRISAVGFAGMGRVAEHIEDLNLDGFKPSYGGGLRIMLDKVDRVNLRLDVGFGEDGNTGIYFGFTEAF